MCRRKQEGQSPLVPVRAGPTTIEASLKYIPPRGA